MKTPTQVSTPRYHTNDVPSFGFMSSRGSIRASFSAYQVGTAYLGSLGTRGDQRFLNKDRACQFGRQD